MSDCRGVAVLVADDTTLIRIGRDNVCYLFGQVVIEQIDLLEADT